MMRMMAPSLYCVMYSDAMYSDAIAQLYSSLPYKRLSAKLNSTMSL